MKIATVLFREVLQSVYGPLDWLPLGDGEIHRFHVPGDKPGRLNGWYVLFIDSIAAGAFGSWKTGTTHTWCSRQPQNHHEAEQVREHIERARKRRGSQALPPDKGSGNSGNTNTFLNKSEATGTADQSSTRFVWQVRRVESDSPSRIRIDFASTQTLSPPSFNAMVKHTAGRGRRSHHRRHNHRP